MTREILTRWGADLMARQRRYVARFDAQRRKPHHQRRGADQRVRLGQEMTEYFKAESQTP